jgi:hypothetical protein
VASRTTFILSALSIIVFLQGCRVIQQVPTGGEVVSRTGLYDCPESTECNDEILTDEPWSESYMAVPREGYEFTGWGDGLCSNKGPQICRMVNIPTDYTSADADTFLRPIFELAPTPGAGDSDGDSLPDAWEGTYGLDDTDPLDAYADGDADGLDNLAEYENLSSPNESDSDFDGMDDAYEYANGLQADVDDAGGDLDGDGALNIEEALAGTMASYGASVPGDLPLLEFGSQEVVDNASFSDWSAFPAALAQGGVVVVWSTLNDLYEDQGIYGQLYNSNGRAFDAPFPVTASLGPDFRCPQAVGLDNGDFIVSWYKKNAAGTNTSIFVRRYDANAQAQGPAVKIASKKSSVGAVGCARLNELADGEVLVTWYEYNPNFEEYKTVARIIDPDGVPLGGEIAIAGSPDRESQSPAVVEKPNGVFFVVWSSEPQSGLNLIEGQAFTRAGEPKSEVVQISTDDTRSHVVPRVSRLENGNLIVVWNADDIEAETGEVRARIISINGVPKSDVFTVSSDDLRYTDTPQVAASGSTFLVTWHSRPLESGVAAVYGRLYDQSGAPLDGDFIVSSYVDISQSGSRVTTLSDGSFFATWYGFYLDELFESTITLRQYRLVE